MRKLCFVLMLCVPMVAQAAVDVNTTRIGHGVRAWYASDQSVPVVHVAISFEGAGSISDPQSRAGRAALAASMLTEGAGSLDSTGFQRALEDKAIQLDMSASDDRLTINVHCLREHAVRAGELLAMALNAPHFADEDLARVKMQTLSMLARLEESPGFQATRKFEEVAFAGHPYAGAHYGTSASVRAMSAQDLRDYMATYVTRSNVLIAAAGDVDSSLLDTMLEPVVKALGHSDAGPVRATTMQMQGAGQSLSVEMDVPQSVVLFAAPSVARDDKRFYGMYLLNEILGGNVFTARLADGLRQKKGLVYGVNTALENRDGIALLRGNLATRTERTQESIEAVKTILSDLRTRGVTTQECEDARLHVLGAFPLQLDGSQNIANTLLMMRMYHLGEDYIDERAKKFNAVSCTDLNTLAKEFLAPERFLFVTAGKAS